MRHSAMPKIAALLVLLATLASKAVESTNLETKPEIIVTEAEIGTHYNGTVRNSMQRIYFYSIPPQNGNFINSNVRLRVETDNSTGDTDLDSLSVTIIKPSDLSSSFRLPTFSNRNGLVVNITKDEKYTAERTICILHKPNSTNSSVPLSVVFSTRSETNIRFNISIIDTQNFLLELSKPRNLIISPNTPHFFRYNFTESQNSVVVLAESPSDRCMTLSVQIPVCPIFDREDNIHYGGIYQTITSSGALIVEREKPFLDGFIVVIIAHSDHEQCQRRDPFSLPFSNLFSSSLNHLGTPITITITSNDSNVLTSLQILYWMIPILMAIGVTLLLFAILFVRHRFIRTTEFHREERMNTCQGRRIRELCMGNFQRSGKSKRASFCYLVFLVGVFYCIPVIQFALYYYQVSIVTGDSDLCYYNYRCAHPVWFFLDFNHIVSNLPYVFFGVMIFIFVKLHKTKLDQIRPVGEIRHDANESQILVGNDNEGTQQDSCEVEAQNGNSDAPQRDDWDGRINLVGQPDFGVPLNYDIFQALGVALIAEGVLSASYHLCPNEATFQFDTCFMYVIALLTIVHLFQSRHPHCFSPNHAFLTLVFIVVPTVFSIVGNFLSSTLVTIIMSIFLIITFLVSIYVGFKYGFLEQRQDVHAPMRIVTFPNFEKLIKPGTNIYKLRLILPAGHLVMSILVGSYWILDRCPLSTYMLYLLVGNMCWNIVYYIFMKTLHGELTLKGCVFPFLYSAIAIGFGVYAITFYFHAAARWELSPPASLAVNQECLTVLGVEYPFDSHDVWHILSATAIFCAFNLLLTLDDDLVATRQAHISVF